VHSILQYISVILLSSIKLGFGGVPLSIVYGFDLKMIIILNVIGGTIGVFIFVNIGEWLNQKINIYFAKRFTPKKFTTTNRFVIRLKKFGGIYGLCFITPLLFSFPLGCLITTRYYKNKTKVIAIMLVFVVFWSVLLGSLGSLI